MARSTRMTECEGGEGDNSDGVEKENPCSLLPCGGDTVAGSGYEGDSGAKTTQSRRSGRSELKRTTQLPSCGTAASRPKAARTRSKGEAVVKRELDKAKNCIKQKRCYYRKQERIRILRAEKQALQRQYASLLEANPEMHPTRFLSLSQHPDEGDGDAENKSKPEKLKAITNLKLVEFYLREQNHWHSQALDKPKERTEKFLNALAPELESLALGSSSRRDEYQKMLQTEHQLMTRSLLSFTKRLNADDYRLLRDEARHQINKLAQNEHFCNFQRTAGGWEAASSADGALFQWSMRKWIHGYGADEVAKETWKIFADPERLEKLYSPQVRMTCRVVHVVDSNNVVLLQQFHGIASERSATQEPLTQTIPDATALSLVSFFKTEKGFMTIMRRLPRKSKGDLVLSTADASCEVWTDLLCWMENEYDGEVHKHTLYKFSGTMPAVGKNASFWSLKVLMLAVNWENMVLGIKLPGPATASYLTRMIPPLQNATRAAVLAAVRKASRALALKCIHAFLFRRIHSKNMELAQVVAVITGGARGFGKAFADTILAAGGKVLITDINAEGVEASGEKLAAKYGVKRVGWMRQDVTEPNSFGAAFEHARTHFGDSTVNMLVNNAGILADLTFYNEGTPTNWNRVVEINLVATMRGTQVAVEQFKKLLPPGDEGVVINVASIAGLYAVPLLPEYAAAKAGVVSLTRSLYHLKASHNIRVVALCPSFADTDMGQLAEASLPELTSQQNGLIPLPEIVAAFVAIVTEPANTGRCLRVMPGDRRYMRFDGDEQLFPNSGLDEA